MLVLITRDREGNNVLLAFTICKSEMTGNSMWFRMQRTRGGVVVERMPMLGELSPSNTAAVAQHITYFLVDNVG